MALFGASFISINYLASPPGQRENEKKIVVDIPRGMGLRAIAKELEDAGIIIEDKAFIIGVLIKGAKKKLKAGEYEFSTTSPLSAVIDKLVKGDVLIHRITIPEGLTTKEIAGLLDSSGVVPKEEFLGEASDKEFINELTQAQAESLEGYLFPDSYSYKKGVTAEDFIRMIVGRFNEIYAPLKSNAAARRDLTDHEILTLASIIEKETSIPEERPLISAVFYNRLKYGMRLQSDPTVIYGLEEFNGNLIKEDLKTETSYNTYVIHRIPPGPICNPGKASLEAALEPAQSDYLYFVSRGDGTHEFSSNYRDHIKAVKKYQNPSGCKMQDAGYTIQDARCRMQDTR